MPLSIKTKFDYWKKCNDLGEFRNPRRFFLNPAELRHILKALVETFSFKRLTEGQKERDLTAVRVGTIGSLTSACHGKSKGSGHGSR